LRVAPDIGISQFELYFLQAIAFFSEVKDTPEGLNLGRSDPLYIHE
jgi:hypothetical protein